MQEPQGNFILKNVANFVSILGVLPLCILFWEDGYQYLVPLIIYNNIMDDLDGVLAVRMEIKSELGALLDNVCDAVSHTVFVMVVGMHYCQNAGNVSVGGVCVASSLLAAVAIILRVVTRLDPKSVTGTGSPTNELIRHIFLVVLVAQSFGFSPTPLLIAAFSVHAVTMLVPFRMPYLIRSLTKSPLAVGLVNVALVVAWLVPYAAPVIGMSFLVTYFVSFLVGGIGWLMKADSDKDDVRTIDGTPEGEQREPVARSSLDVAKGSKVD